MFAKVRRLLAIPSSLAVAAALLVVGAGPATASPTVATDCSSLKTAFSHGGSVSLGGDITCTTTHLAVVTGESVTLDLAGHTLSVTNVDSDHAGIEAPGGASLTIDDSDGGGKLEVAGAKNAAGIGGGNDDDGGTVTITGGTITVTGGGSTSDPELGGAGIGGGNGGDGGDVTITGGTVNASNGYLGHGAGIGGGYGGAGGTVTITGGAVTTTSGYGSAGIGGGDGGAGGDVTIKGGAVTASGGFRGAGIGGGAGGGGGTVKIIGGLLTASGGFHGAGIGGGGGGAGGAVTIGAHARVIATQGQSTPTAIGAGGGGAGGAGFGSLYNAGTLTLPAGSTLIIPSGVRVPNTGTIVNEGSITGTGEITNEGTILNGGTVSDAGHGGPGELLVSYHNYTLDFDANGGTRASAPAHVYAATAGVGQVGFPADPNPPDGKTFTGWYTTATGGARATRTTDLETLLGFGPTSLTLYAHYASAGGGGGGTGGGDTGGGGGGANPPSAGVTVERIAGENRFKTAVASSQAEFPIDGSAGAVVMASGEAFPDALVGTPLAADKKAPLLLTRGGSLRDAPKAELQRVLKPGGTVYVLGGTAVMPTHVIDQLHTLGYKTVRLGGADRYGTAVQVADALGDPSTILLAGGRTFPDALSAGVAAAQRDAAVLLTKGSQVPGPTSRYLSAHARTVYAVGGPAAAADPEATAIFGANRYATSVAVAKQFFTSPAGIGVASGVLFPDASTSGALLAHEGVPLVLARTNSLPTVVADYLTNTKASIKTARVFGGTSALTEAVQTAIENALAK